MGTQTGKVILQLFLTQEESQEGHASLQISNCNLYILLSMVLPYLRALSLALIKRIVTVSRNDS